MTCESLKRGRGELKSSFPFFLFQISYLLLNFLIILSNAKVSKNKYAVEKEKREWWISGWEKEFKCKLWKKAGKENGITTGLPPGESFTFIVREQDCLHTFED
jgi:hypothetical protein